MSGLPPDCVLALQRDAQRLQRRLEDAACCVAALQALGVAGPWKHSTLYDCAAWSLRAMSPGYVAMSDFWVSESVRGQGIGRELLALLCDFADLYAVQVVIRPHAFNRSKGSMTTPQLRAWYARNHFCTVDGSELMRRGPQPQGDAL